MDLVAATKLRQRTTADLVINAWTLNKELFRRSSLAVFTLQKRPIMLLVCDFATQPFGKRLPPIDSICKCRASRAGEAKRSWLAHCSAKDGAKVKDIKLDVQCSRCGTKWLLDSSALDGILHQRHGMYYVEVPVNCSIA